MFLQSLEGVRCGASVVCPRGRVAGGTGGVTMRMDAAEWADVSELRGFAVRVWRREAGRWWWAPLVAGVVWFVIAWLVLRMDITSLRTVGVLVGVLFLVNALHEAAVAGFVVGGWKLAHYVMAVGFVLGAVWAFARPIDTFFALVSVLGLLLFLQGALSIARGVALRGVSPFWGLELVSGMLVALLAFWVSISDRYFGLEGRTVFILIWVGFMALFRGFSDMALAFSMLWFAKRGDGREPDQGRAATGASGHIPVQTERGAAEAPRR
jgi:uncharacterized membrane protein HdeD (DUF308 family)